ncbi:hypothetical protein LSAT2_018052, partial [Lamellibrachia satsuma]
VDDLQIDTIVSDRHPQTPKWLREKRPDTNHYFDVWHLAKRYQTCEEMVLLIENKKLIKDMDKLNHHQT